MSLRDFKDSLIQMGKTPKWILILLFVLVMSYIFEALITDSVSRYFRKDEVKQSITKDKIVNGMLTNMMNDFNASRAYVYRFHDGINYYDGSHKIKASMDFEVTQLGITQIGILMQDIPTSLFSRHMSDIMHQKVLFKRFDEIEDKAAKSLMTEFGVTHTCVLPYYNSANKLVMMIGMDWVQRTNDLNPPKDRFEMYVQDIGNVLTNKPVIYDIIPIGGAVRGGKKEIDEVVFDFRKTPLVYTSSSINSKRSALMSILLKTKENEAIKKSKTIGGDEITNGY